MKKLPAALAALLACVVIAGGVAAGVDLTQGTSQSATGSVHPSGWGGTPSGVVLPRALTTAVPTGQMFDAVTLSNIPAHPFAVAGYVAGNWITWPLLAGDFPSAHRVSIAIHLGEHAMCGDFEPGDMDPSTAGTWAKQDTGFGTPCEYGDLSNMPAIKASDAATFGSNWRAHVLLWLAWYRKIPGLVSGYDAVQYDDTCLDRNLDCDTASLNFLRIAQPPYVSPPVLPWCYTHRESAAACAAVKAKVASDQRAAASSARALAATNAVLKANRCEVPYRRSVCVRNGRSAGVFRQRAAFFTAAAKKLQAAN